MYRIQLQQFEGPLDLLLFFIRRDELDIYDIPVAQIADEFLSYVRVMEQIDLDGVGDFLYMSAVLIQIKARLLLPQPEVDDEGDPIDPRRELVERLLEYVRFKEAAEHLDAQREARARLFVRGQAGHEKTVLQGDAEVLDGQGSLFDLISALRRILTKVPPPAYAVAAESYSIEEQYAFVLEKMRSSSRSAFTVLVAARSKKFIIATFLAVLELAREGRIHLKLGPDPDDFYLEATADTGDPPSPPTASPSPPTASPSHPTASRSDHGSNGH